MCLATPNVTIVVLAITSQVKFCPFLPGSYPSATSPGRDITGRLEEAVDIKSLLID